MIENLDKTGTAEESQELYEKFPGTHKINQKVLALLIMKNKETWELAQILDARKIDWIHEPSSGTFSKNDIE